MTKSGRSKLLFVMAFIFIVAISCFFICPEGTFIHDTLPYVLGVIGWIVLVTIFIIDKKNGGATFEPYDKTKDTDN